MNRVSPLIAGVVSLTLAFAFNLTLIAANVELNHQGRLLDASDTPIDGVVTLTFRIFEVPTGGAPLWSETQPGVTVTDGLFATTLGAISPLSADVLTPSAMAPNHWLEVTVNGVVISPRLALGAVPSAAISTRISGDLESKLGHLGLLGASSLSRMDLDDHDDSTGIEISGADGRIIVVKHRLEPHEARLSLGDLNRDGFVDVITTPESTTMLLVDSSSSGSASISSNVHGDLGLQPLGGNLLVHSASNLGESGRLVLSANPDSAGTVISLQDDASSGAISAKIKRSGDTMTGDLILNADPTSTLRLSSGPLESSLNLIDDRDLLGLRRYEAKSSPAIVQVNLLVDANADGSSESSLEQSAEIGQALSRAINTKGTGATLRTTLVAADSAMFATEVDSDNDGITDTGMRCSSIESRTVLESYFSPGAMPSARKFVVMTDSAGAATTLSSGSDGSVSLTSHESRTELRQRFQDGDIPTQDDFVDMSCDASGAGVIMRAPTALLSWGAGLAIRVGNDGPRISMDHDSIPTFEVTSDFSSTQMRLQKAIKDGDTQLRMNASSSECLMELGDVNSDGYALMSTSSSTNPAIPQTSTFRMGRPAVNTAVIAIDHNSAQMELQHSSSGPGDKPTSVQFGTLIDSFVHLTEDGVTRYSLSSSSGMQIRNSADQVSTSIDSDGNGYLSSKLGIGKTPVEKIDVQGGAYCDGTNWVNASDKNSKENFENIDREKLLKLIAQLSITQWNYKGDEQTKHIGPTAQDFKNTFGVGKDDKSISTIDPSGIALAAIQELYSLLKQKDEEIVSLRKTNASQIEELKKELARLREEIKKD